MSRERPLRNAAEWVAQLVQDFRAHGLRVRVESWLPFVAHVAIAYPSGSAAQQASDG